MEQHVSHASLYYTFSLVLQYEQDKNGPAMKSMLVSAVYATGMQDEPGVTLNSYLAFRDSKVGIRSVKRLRLNGNG
ncbi:MAG: hypothetical protein EOP83_04635 [Verrucomicrobiaceae bacterium]|nr:MAG: hypothetical protein EOP83_04635 [Verrucomicrobiaceae bacterium]